MAIVAAALPLAGCTPAVLDPVGPVGRAQNIIFLDTLTIMLAIVVPTIVASWAIAWWFREGNGRATYQPDFAYSGRIEIVTWSVPALTIMFLGGVIWLSSHQLDPARPLAAKMRPVEVEVVSLDWKWLFIYPDQGVASVNTAVVPAGVPVHFRLTSGSVMNAFFVPRLGSMIYTMNGMATQLNLQADRPGVFPGLSTMYSGDGFATMHFEMQAVPPAAFARWVQQVRAAGPTLDAATYRTLSRQSSDVKPFTYRAVAPRLFDAVVTQALPPGPGPSVVQPAQQISPRSRP